jgi:hypothetical protein
MAAIMKGFTAWYTFEHKVLNWPHDLNQMINNTVDSSWWHCYHAKYILACLGSPILGVLNVTSKIHEVCNVH